MSTKKRSTTKRNDPPEARDDRASGETVSSVYRDFSVWTDTKRPKWHPIKKMRYVFYRMINGATVTDALNEIRWSASEFWHLIDLKRNDPFRLEYNRAKRLQGRALGDMVMAISEGRDATTKRALKKTRLLIKKASRRAGKQKNAYMVKMVIESLLSQLNENDQKIVARNKIQMDAAKWLATKVNPYEFSDKSSVAVGGIPGGEGGEQEDAAPIRIQFVNADGSVVDV